MAEEDFMYEEDGGDRRKGPASFYLRTKTQEQRIQDMTPEQQEWAILCEQHHNHEMHAREMARKFLAHLERTRKANEACKCHADCAPLNGIFHVLEMIADRRWVEDVMGVYQVEQSHIKFATELVQQVGKVRYFGWLPKG